MYTIVFKQQTSKHVIFDVFKKPLFGKQRIVGNIFCSKDNTGKYKVTTSIYMASWPKNLKWDGGRKLYFLEENALWICEKFLEEK